MIPTVPSRRASAWIGPSGGANSVGAPGGQSTPEGATHATTRPARSTTQARSSGAVSTRRRNSPLSASPAPGRARSGPSQRAAVEAVDCAMAAPSRDRSSWPRCTSRQSATAVTPVVEKMVMPAMSRKSLRRRLMRAPPTTRVGCPLRVAPPRSHRDVRRRPARAGRRLRSSPPQALRRHGPGPLRAVPPVEPRVRALDQGEPSQRRLPALPPRHARRGARYAARLPGRQEPRRLEAARPRRGGRVRRVPPLARPAVAADRGVARTPHPRLAGEDRVRPLPRRRRARLRAGGLELPGLPRRAPRARLGHAAAPLLRLSQLPLARSGPAPHAPRLPALPPGRGRLAGPLRRRRAHAARLRELPQTAREDLWRGAGRLHHLPSPGGARRAARASGPQPLRRLPCGAPVAHRREGLPRLSRARPRSRPAARLRRLSWVCGRGAARVATPLALTVAPRDHPR